jgi:hypothetical protein
MMIDMASLGFFLFTLVMFLPAEVYLMYVNYLARVKYKEHFKETTKLWLWFDKRGLTVPSLILHFVIITSVMVFLASYSELQFFAGLGVGVLLFNVVIDDRALKRKLLCIEVKCMNLEMKKKCLDCVVPNEYDVSLFPHIKIRKKEQQKRKKE